MSEAAGGFRFLPLGFALLFALLSLGVLELQGLVLGRRVARGKAGVGAPEWTERARLSFGLRAQLTSLTLLFSVFSTWIGVFATGALSVAPRWMVALVAFVGTFGACYFGARRLGRKLGLRQSRGLRGFLEFVFWLRGGIMAIGLFAGGAFFAFGARDDDPSAIISGGLAVAASLAFPIVLFRLLARRRSDLEGAWEPLFLRLVRPKAVYEIRASSANAFAFPLGKTIAVTSRLLEELSPEEVEAIVAHELGHLREGPKALFRVLPLALGMLELLVGAFFLPLWATLTGLFVVILATSVAVRKLAVRFEEHADDSAREGSDPKVFASALLRVHELNLNPVVLHGTTQPSQYDRLTASGVDPGFARPNPPAKGLSEIALFPFIVLLGGLILSPFILEATTQPTEALEAKAALGRDPWALGELARREFVAGRKGNSLALYREAYAEAPENPWYSLNLALTLANLRECEEAARYFAEARFRARTLSSRDEAVELELAEPLECEPELPTDDRVPPPL